MIPLRDARSHLQARAVSTCENILALKRIRVHAFNMRWPHMRWPLHVLLLLIGLRSLVAVLEPLNAKVIKGK